MSPRRTKTKTKMNMKTVMKIEFYVTIQSRKNLDRKKVVDSARTYILPSLRKQILAAKLELPRVDYGFLQAELNDPNLKISISDNLDLLQESSKS